MNKKNEEAKVNQHKDKKNEEAKNKHKDKKNEEAKNRKNKNKHSTYLVVLISVIEILSECCLLYTSDAADE